MEGMIAALKDDIIGLQERSQFLEVRKSGPTHVSRDSRQSCHVAWAFSTSNIMQVSNAQKMTQFTLKLDTKCMVSNIHPRAGCQG